DLGASLVARPPVIILDEPTTGLDPRSRVEMWGFIESLVADGTTILLTTQYLDEADRLAHQIVVIDYGKVIAEGTSDELKDQLGGDVVEVRVATSSDLDKALAAIAGLGDGKPQVDAEQRRMTVPAKSGAATLMAAARRLDESEVTLEDLGLRRPSLDDVFMALTGHGAGAIQTPGSTYVDFLMAGIFVQTTLFGGAQTAVGLAEDLRGGIVDRFRSLPMARSAVLAGRTFADLARNVFVLLLMVIVATGVGFRFHNGAVPSFVAMIVVLAFGYAFSWVFAYIGMVVKEPETAQVAGFIPLFPLVFASSAFVPVASMPGWLQGFARVQPVSVTVNAVRALTQGGPIYHWLWQMIVWTGLILVVFVPLAVARYRRI